MLSRADLHLGIHLNYSARGAASSHVRCLRWTLPPEERCRRALPSRTFKVTFTFCLHDDASAVPPEVESISPSMSATCTSSNASTLTRDGVSASTVRRCAWARVSGEARNMLQMSTAMQTSATRMANPNAGCSLEGSSICAAKANALDGDFCLRYVAGCQAPGGRGI